MRFYKKLSAAIQNGLHDAINPLCHSEKAEIGRMAAIDGAAFRAKRAEVGFSIHKIDIFISGFPRVLIGLQNDIAAQDGFGGILKEIRTGAEDHGSGRMRGTYNLKKWLVRSGEMFRRGRVVVVIHYENGKVLFCDDLRHSRLTFCHAVKPEILVIAVKPAAQHRGIRVAGDAGAVAVRDGGTVEQQLFRGRIFIRRENLIVFVNTDLQCRNSVIEWQMDCNLAQALFFIGIAQPDCFFYAQRGVILRADDAAILALETGSVVVPAMSETMARSCPVIALMRLDFPALRLPKMPICTRSALGAVFMLIQSPQIQNHSPSAGNGGSMYLNIVYRTNIIS